MSLQRLLNGHDELYFMAPLQNAPTIALFGVLSHTIIQSSPEVRDLITSIASITVNQRRHNREHGGRSLHSYVPLYWATKTPMQRVATVIEQWIPQEELVFFVFNAEEILALPGVLSSDGNVAAQVSDIYEGAGALPYIDWGIIDNPKCYSKEYKRKKAAEVLVPDRIRPELIHEIRVFTEGTQKTLQNALAGSPSRLSRTLPPIHVTPDHYYASWEL